MSIPIPRLVLKKGLKLCSNCGAVMSEFDLGLCTACVHPEMSCFERIYPKYENTEYSY